MAYMSLLTDQSFSLVDLCNRTARALVAGVVHIISELPFSLIRVILTIH